MKPATSEEEDRIVGKWCHHCDFGTGYRGMDRCRVCDGTGSVFYVYGRSYANTQEGYNQALRALRREDGLAHAK